MLRFELCSVAFDPSYSPYPSNLAERVCNFFTRFILLFIPPCRVPRGYELFLLRPTIFRLFALFTSLNRVSRYRIENYIKSQLFSKQIVCN